MESTITINGRKIGPSHPVYIIAEMSANHDQDYEKAIQIIHSMKECGADAVKIQTYTPDTMTIDCDKQDFIIGKGTIWEGRNLHELYGEAFTPWEWQPKLKAEAEKLGMDLFSTAYDETSVDFLEEMDMPAYKIASFELVDIPLLKKIAKLNKPMIMSTGMATLEEIADAVDAVKSECNEQIVLLKCTSAYPAPPEDMNLRTIPDMIKRFNCPIGLSDHSLDSNVPLTAVKLGACVVEKHYTLSRSKVGPDSAFSLEPEELTAMIKDIRSNELGELDEVILGEVRYGPSKNEKSSIQFRRSLYAIEDITEGEEFTNKNVRPIRPGNGLPPKEIYNLIGKKASENIERGVALSWEMIE
jgi:pseudaminic acid synthase